MGDMECSTICDEASLLGAERRRSHLVVAVALRGALRAGKALPQRGWRKSWPGPFTGPLWRQGADFPYLVGGCSYRVTFVLLCDMVELLEYVNASGISPFAKWRGKLDPTTRARITVGVLRLELGNFSAAKGVGGGIFELRYDFGPGYRVYFGKDGERLVILLGGGTKKRQQNDIEAAQELWQEYKRTKGK
jgi:putative addiction module killer protein